MGDLLIRSIPEPLKTDIAKAAGRDRTNLSAKAIDLLRKGLDAERQAEAAPKQSAWDVLRSGYEEYGPISDEEDRIMKEIMDEIEAERKRDFGRPLPDFE